MHVFALRFFFDAYVVNGNELNLVSTVSGVRQPDEPVQVVGQGTLAENSFGVSAIQLDGYAIAVAGERNSTVKKFLLDGKLL